MAVGVCLALIAVGVTVMYLCYMDTPIRPALLCGEDQWSQSGTMAFTLDYFLHRGEFPLWNPFVFCGVPFAANPMAALFNPMNIARSLLTLNPTPLSTNWGLVIMTWLMVVVAGINTYFLARDLGLTHAASLGAAFANVFSGDFVFESLAHWYVIAVVAWLPLLLLHLRRAFRAPDRRRRVRHIVFGGLAFSMTVLGGFPQGLWYVAIACVAYTMLHQFADRSSGRGRRVIADTLSLGGIVAIGSLLATPLLLPASEYASLCGRSNSSGLDALGWAEPHSPIEILRYAILYPGPELFGHEFRISGLIALLLAILSLFHKRRGEVLVLAAVFAILLDCSLGPPFPIAALIGRIAPFQMPLPSRALLTAGLFLALLTGFGIDSIRALRLPMGLRAARAGLTVGLGGAMLFLAWSWLPDFWLPAPRTVLLVPLAGVLVIAYGYCANANSLCRPALAGLIFMEIFLWNRYFIPAVMDRGKPPSDIPWQELAKAPAVLDCNTRISDPHPNYQTYFGRIAMTGYDPLFPTLTRQTICSPAAESYYTRAVTCEDVVRDSFRGHLLLKRPFWLVRQYVSGALPPKDTLFPVATTTFLSEDEPGSIPKVDRSAIPATSVSDNRSISRIGAGERRSHGRNVSYAFLVRHPQGQSALALHYMVNDTGVLNVTYRNVANGWTESGPRLRLAPTTPDGRIVELPLPDFREMQIQLAAEVERGANDFRVLDTRILSDRADESDHITITGFGANTVDVKLNGLDGPRLLVFVDSFFSGWRAYIDGQPTPILRADEAFKAVTTPAGDHLIRFVFRPWRVYAGVAISLATIGFLTVLLLWPSRIARRQSQGGAMGRSVGNPLE